jgi:hypothetical protein
MNTQSLWSQLAAVLGIAVAGVAWYVWFKVFNTEAGERYQKLRTQGPFVPIDEDAPIQPK